MCGICGGHANNSFKCSNVRRLAQALQSTERSMLPSRGTVKTCSNFGMASGLTSFPLTAGTIFSHARHSLTSPPEGGDRRTQKVLPPSPLFHVRAAGCRMPDAGNIAAEEVRWEAGLLGGVCASRHVGEQTAQLSRHRSREARLGRNASPRTRQKKGRSCLGLRNQQR